MNKKILFISLVVTMLFSFLIIRLYKSIVDSECYIYLLQLGAYSNIDNVYKVTKDYSSYLVMKEDNLYKVFIGASRSEEGYNKLIKYFGSDVNIYKKNYDIKNKDILEIIDKYDNALLKANDKDTIDLIVEDEIKLLSKYIKV